jgi:hypothetical protein
MDRVRKLNISESYTPSSESYSNYLCVFVTIIRIYSAYFCTVLLQLPRVLRHEMFSPGWTMGLYWIVGLNPTRSMGVCLRLFCVFLSCVGRKLASGDLPFKKSYRLSKTKKLNWNKAFNGYPMLQDGATGTWIDGWMGGWMNGPTNSTDRETDRFPFTIFVDYSF